MSTYLLFEAAHGYALFQVRCHRGNPPLRKLLYAACSPASAMFNLIQAIRLTRARPRC